MYAFDRSSGWFQHRDYIPNSFQPSLPAKKCLKKVLFVFHSVCLSLRIMPVSTERRMGELVEIKKHHNRIKKELSSHLTPLFKELYAHLAGEKIIPEYDHP